MDIEKMSYDEISEFTREVARKTKKSLLEVDMLKFSELLPIYQKLKEEEKNKNLEA